MNKIEDKQWPKRTHSGSSPWLTDICPGVWPFSGSFLSARRRRRLENSDIII